MLVCSLGIYVDKICVVNVFTYSWIQNPIYDFICATSAGLFVCITTYFWQRGIVYICFRDFHAPWSDPLSLFNFFEDKNESWRSVVEHFCLFWLWYASIVSDVEPMLGRRQRATSTQRRSDVGPTSHGRYRPNVGSTSAQLLFPCSFFHPIICQNLLCAEIVPMMEATIRFGPVLAWLQTYCTLTCKFYPY